jgi:GNAT superfamily N-acetyltransferase
MKLVGISEDTERAFFTCLHLEEPENLKDTAPLRNWYAEYKDKGYKAKVLILDDGRIVGKCHYIPVEYSPFVGENLLAILCITVWPYEYHIGDQRNKGYGRFMLNHIEQYARSSGFGGVVAWAMDWDWNPVSFYQHMGYVITDRKDKVVVVWKSFKDDAQPPTLLRIDNLFCKGSEKVQLLVADNPWCNGYRKLTVTMEAIKGIEELIEYIELGFPFRNRMIHLGYVGGVFLDGKAYRPYQPIGKSDDLRSEIIRIYNQKQQKLNEETYKLS